MNGADGFLQACVCVCARVCGARARKHGHKIRWILKKGTKMGIKRGRSQPAGGRVFKVQKEETQNRVRDAHEDLSLRTPYPHTGPLDTL